MIRCPSVRPPSHWSARPSASLSVGLSVCAFVRNHVRVCSVTLQPLEGYQRNLTQMFTTLREPVYHMFRGLASRSRSYLCSKVICQRYIRAYIAPHCDARVQSRSCLLVLIILVCIQLTTLPSLKLT